MFVFFFDGSKIVNKNEKKGTRWYIIGRNGMELLVSFYTPKRNRLSPCWKIDGFFEL